MAHMSLIRNEVVRLKGYHLDTPQHRIKLNQNESPYDLPEPVKKKILERLAQTPWNRYPSPFCDPLRNKISQKEGWNIDGVVVAGGSNILIQAIVIAAAIKGKILTVTPGFSLYDIEGALLGNRVIKVPLGRDDFSFSRDLFLKRMKREKPDIIFLANPNAPTGNLFSQEDLFSVLKAAKGLVVVDEAYYPFSGFTLRPRLKQFPNLILVRTLSKAFSLGGVRLGYLLAHPKIAKDILKVILPFSVGILSQIVGEVVLEEDSYVDGLVKEIVEERERLYLGLKKIWGLKVYPSQSNYILFRSPTAKRIFAKLLEEGILIRNVSTPDLPNALRVTVGTPEENRLFLEAIQKSLP